MALVLLEGLDRTGKSTVASYFETLGFEKIHLSAPAKGITPDQYLQEMIDLISSAATKDIVLDRTHYGELVWPQIYGRKALLDEESIEALREVEESVGVQRLWMTDDDLKAHWQRCVDNKEPLDKAQFTRARGLFSSLANKYGFEKVTLQTFLKQFPDAKDIVDSSTAANLEAKTNVVNVSDLATSSTQVEIQAPILQVPILNKKSPEQHKLEVANAINEVLSKRILKSKGIVYDDIENEIRHFLNTKLGKLLGGASSSGELSLTQDEIKFYKTMYKRANDKGVN
jgi:hypothetical protein